MADKAIYSVDTVSTMADTDKVYVNTGNNIKQISKANLLSGVNDSLTVIGKCKNLLKPTLQTTAISKGVTCTNNGDGTYTLNGTASATTVFNIGNVPLENGKTYKMVGCPSGGAVDTKYVLSMRVAPFSYDEGSGKTFNWASDNTSAVFGIVIYANYTCNNLVFKPMITTNLNATYDDFVPYTGNGNTLTSDVADINNQIDVVKNDLNELTKTVTVTLSSTNATESFDVKSALGSDYAKYTVLSFELNGVDYAFESNFRYVRFGKSSGTLAIQRASASSYGGASCKVTFIKTN